MEQEVREMLNQLQSDTISNADNLSNPSKQQAKLIRQTLLEQIDKYSLDGKRSVDQVIISLDSLVNRSLSLDLSTFYALSQP